MIFYDMSSVPSKRREKLYQGWTKEFKLFSDTINKRLFIQNKAPLLVVGHGAIYSLAKIYTRVAHYRMMHRAV